MGVGAGRRLGPHSATLPTCPTHTIKFPGGPAYRGGPIASLPEGIAVPTSLASSLPSHPRPLTAVATKAHCPLHLQTVLLGSFFPLPVLTHLLKN